MRLPIHYTPCTHGQSQLHRHFPRYGRFKQLVPLRKTQICPTDQPEQLRECGFVREVVPREDTDRDEGATLRIEGVDVWYSAYLSASVTLGQV